MSDIATQGLLPHSQTLRTRRVETQVEAIQRNRAGASLTTIGSGGSVADATTSVKGKLKLAGDIEGTADLPRLRKGTSTDMGAQGVYDIRDFASGLEGADIYAAATAAIAAMPTSGGILSVPLKRTLLTASLLVNKPVKMLGAGASMDVGGTYAAWNPATEIKWTGASGGTMIKVVGPLQAGWGFDGFGLHGNSGTGTPANCGIDFNRAQGGTIGVLGAKNFQAAATVFDFNTVGATGTAENTHFIQIDALWGFVYGVFIKFRGSETPYDGTTGTATVHANSCHITIGKVAGWFGLDGTANGIEFASSDNNVIQDAFLWTNGTGYAVEFGGYSRSNGFIHLQPNNGIVCRTPTVKVDTAGSTNLGGKNFVKSYDRENSQPGPTIESGARLDVAQDSRLGEGRYFNVQTAAHTNTGTGGWWTLKAGGSVATSGAENVEIVAQAAADDRTASLDAVGNDSGTTVWAQIQARKEGDALIGTRTDHPALFMSNTTESFRILQTSQHVKFATGKWIGMGVTPVTAIHLATGAGGDTKAEGIQFGSNDANAVNMFRSAVDELRIGDDSNINSIALNCGGMGSTGLPGSATVAAADTLYVNMNKAGFFDIGRTSGAAVFRVFKPTAASALSAVTTPVFAVGSGGQCTWGPGGTTATDHTLDRLDANYMKFSVSLEVTNALRLADPGGGGFIELPEQTITPGVAPTDSIRLYAKDASGVTKLFTKDSTGTETELGSGSGSAYAILSGTTTDTLAVRSAGTNTFQTIASNTTAGVARLSFLDQGTEKWRVQQGGGSGIETDFQFNVIDATDANHLVRFMSGIPQSTGSTKHRWEYNVSATLPASGRRILNTNVLSTVTGTVSQPSAYDLIDVLQASAHLNTSGGANGISMVALIGEAKVSAAQSADNEVAYLRGASFDQTTTGNIHPTMWGQDLFVHGTRAASGTTGEQNRKIFNIVCGINTYHSSSPSHAPAVGMSITTKYGDVLGAPAGNTDRTHTVDTGLSIHGWAGDANGISHANSKIGFKYAIKIGGTGAWYSGDPWTDTTQHSRIGTGIAVMHYETAGIKVTNRSTIGATSPPAISIGWDNAGAASVDPMDGITFGGDAYLHRNAANVLYTPGGLGASSTAAGGAAGNGLYSAPTGRLDVTRSGAAMWLRHYNTGTGTNAMVTLGDGSTATLGLRFGVGTSDTTLANGGVGLYRSTTSTLRTDGSFVAAGTLSVLGNTVLSGTSTLTGAVDMLNTVALQGVAGTGFVQVAEQTSAVAAPAAGFLRTYMDGGNFVMQTATNTRVVRADRAASDYTITNGAADLRTLDGTSGTAADVRQVLETLIEDLQAEGILQ